MAPIRRQAAGGRRRRGRPPKGVRGDTRQDLLDAALRLFARQGYAATTVRQIAEEVDIRDAAIYAHFTAKQEILDALVTEANERWLERLDLDFRTLADRRPAEVLPELIHGILEEWDLPRNRMLISLLTREGLMDAAAGVADLRKRLCKPFRAWASRGDIRQDVDPDTAVEELTLFLAAVRMLYLNARAGTARRRKGRQLAERHVNYFLITMSTQPRGSGPGAGHDNRGARGEVLR